MNRPKGGVLVEQAVFPVYFSAQSFRKTKSYVPRMPCGEIAAVFKNEMIPPVAAQKIRFPTGFPDHRQRENPQAEAPIPGVEMLVAAKRGAVGDREVSGYRGGPVQTAFHLEKRVKTKSPDSGKAGVGGGVHLTRRREKSRKPDFHMNKAVAIGIGDLGVLFADDGHDVT